MVSYDQLENRQKLTETSSSVVYKAHLENTRVAFKELRVQDEWKVRQMDNEITILGSGNVLRVAEAVFADSVWLQSTLPSAHCETDRSLP